MRRLLHWTKFPVRVYFVPGELADRERVAATRAGFDEWVSATHGVVRCRIVTDSAQADVTVRFLPEATIPDKEGATGNTRLTFSGLVLKKACVRLAAADATPADLQETAAHEFGHVLGMDGHSDDADDLMSPVLSRNPPPGITLRDLNTLRIAYPGMTVFPPQKPSRQAPER